MEKVSTLVASLFASAAVLLMATTISVAADQPAASMDIDKLKAEIADINEQAQAPQGESIIAKQLADDFSVSSDTINVLLGSLMQYGEVAAVLAFAEKLPGGITDSNIDKVMETRYQGAWEDVAENFDINPGTVVGRLSGVQEDIQTALSESSAEGRAAGGVDDQPGEAESVPGETMPGEGAGESGTFEGGGMGGQSSEQPEGEKY